MFRATVRLMVLAVLLLLVVPVTAQEDMAAQVEALMASEPSFEYAESIVNFENEGLNIIGTLGQSHIKSQWRIMARKRTCHATRDESVSLFGRVGRSSY
jgi:hypothetical protein